MSKLVSMKVDRSSREEKSEAMSTPGDSSPIYPYGLNISLNEDALEKLDVGVGDFTIGAELVIVAKVRVDSLSSNASIAGGDSARVGLQITDLCLEDNAAKAESAATALYGKGDKG
jgi:hypothetical protein